MLVAGPRAAGKTALLRDAARLLAEQVDVLVVDPDGELGGCGDAPHPALGAARLTTVPTAATAPLGSQLLMMLRHHRPEVLVIDDIDVWCGDATAEVLSRATAAGVHILCGATVQGTLLLAAASGFVGEGAAATISHAWQHFTGAIELSITHEISMHNLLQLNVV